MAGCEVWNDMMTGCRWNGINRGRLCFVWTLGAAELTAAAFFSRNPGYLVAACCYLAAAVLLWASWVKDGLE